MEIASVDESGIITPISHAEPDSTLETGRHLISFDPKPTDVIRKNMLFHDTSRGARSGAIIKSLIDTAAANNLDPQLYLFELLEHARDYVNEPARAAEYMPWTEEMQRRCKHKTRKDDPGQ